MYLAEVDEEVLRENLRTEGYHDGFNDGFNDGFHDGFHDGRQTFITELVEAKLKAGKPLEQIAAELEQPVEEIKEIYESLIAKNQGR